jgi:hypothetical protein
MHIVNTQNASDTQRLATYRNAYYGRLAEALATDFPTVKTILGDEKFSRLCHDYIDTYPSTQYSLRWFGNHFADFIHQHAFNQQQIFLAELAKLEWTFISAFDAADVNPLPVTRVIDIPSETWPDIRIGLHPSVHYFNYHWNIVDIWHAVQEQDPIPQAAPLSNTSTCVIWRQALSTRYRILDEFEGSALHAAAQGASFAQICETLAELTDDEETDFNHLAMLSASLLKTWLSEDMIVHLSSHSSLL